jgi:hypothetical protein
MVQHSRMRIDWSPRTDETMPIFRHSNKVALVKIAPGHDAEYWPQCLKEGYICVGWDDVGDLRRFDSVANFRKVFEKHYKYGGNSSTTRRKANELWTLTKLQAGDRIIANKGMSVVLAVGVVEEPGYEWRPNNGRREYYHTVKVKWDTSFSRRIPQQPWRQTVTEVPYKLFRKIAGRAALSRNSVLSLRQGWDDGGASHRGWTNIEVRAGSRAEKKAAEEIERAAGFQSDTQTRKITELHAMDLVKVKFRAAGYEVEDVSAYRPYDFLCRRGSRTKYVEVKGTQTGGRTVVLTAGEVAFMRRNSPNCVLCVVSGIKISGHSKPTASGGRISTDDPVDLSIGSLNPISYVYARISS